MKMMLAAALAANLAISGVAAAATLSGAGSTFAAPIYQKWAATYAAQSGNKLNYQSIGSGAGIKLINGGTVDFGASDMPLSPDVLAHDGLSQFPTVIGGVVPVVNIPGVAPGRLRLTGPILSDIYRGIRRYWDDPVIQSYNRGLKLPHLPITVVHRSDGSGTTYIFTDYLAQVAPHWRSGPGVGVSVAWPVGLGGKGSDGVAAYVRQTSGSIGYVEYAYSLANRMTYAVMRNRAGRWVAPTAANFAASAGNARWNMNTGFDLMLTNQPGAASWPISGATFILVRTKQANPASGREVLAFFDWAYHNGDKDALSLDYVPLPASVKALVRNSWRSVTGPNGQPVYP